MVIIPLNQDEWKSAKKKKREKVTKKLKEEIKTNHNK